MSRVQLALNVANLEESVDFYTKLFDTEPAKVRPGYANFAVADPPLKLVLIEDATKAAGSLNHLGVEVRAPTRFPQPGPGSKAPASPPRSRTTSPVVTPCRTRCGQWGRRRQLGVLHRAGRRRYARGPHPR